MPSWFRWTVIAASAIFMAASFKGWHDEGTLSGFQFCTVLLVIIGSIFEMALCDVGRKPLEELGPGHYRVAAVLCQEQGMVWFVLRHTDGRTWWHREYRLPLTGFYGDDLRGRGTLMVTAVPGGQTFLYARDKERV